MTRTWREGEAWIADEGAPAGPSFTTTITSSRPGHGPYTITRDHVTGTVLHQPVCEAWSFGNKTCAHVREAIGRAENPWHHFFTETHGLFANLDWWARHLPPAYEEFFGRFKREMDAVLAAEGELEAWQRFQTRRRVTSDEAAAELGAPLRVAP